MNTPFRATKLRSLGYTDVATDVAFLKWMLARGATSAQVKQAEKEFLVGKGFTTGALDDRWNRYLRSLTYTGSRNDMEKAFWNGVNSN